MIGLSRMISISARGGIDIYTIIDQLNSTGACPSYTVRRATKGGYQQGVLLSHGGRKRASGYVPGGTGGAEGAKNQRGRRGKAGAEAQSRGRKEGEGGMSRVRGALKL